MSSLILWVNYSSVRLRRLQIPEEPIVFVIGTRREIKHPRATSLASISESQRPKPINENRQTAGIGELSEEFPCRKIECVNGAVAKVAYQEGIAEIPKIARQGESPGRV